MKIFKECLQDQSRNAFRGLPRRVKLKTHLPLHETASLRGGGGEQRMNVGVLKLCQLQNPNAWKPAARVFLCVIHVRAEVWRGVPSASPHAHVSHSHNCHSIPAAGQLPKKWNSRCTPSLTIFRCVASKIRFPASKGADFLPPPDVLRAAYGHELARSPPRMLEERMLRGTAALRHWDAVSRQSATEILPTRENSPQSTEQRVYSLCPALTEIPAAVADLQRVLQRVESNCGCRHIVAAIFLPSACRCPA